MFRESRGMLGRAGVRKPSVRKLSRSHCMSYVRREISVTLFHIPLPPFVYSIAGDSFGMYCRVVGEVYLVDA